MSNRTMVKGLPLFTQIAPKPKSLLPKFVRDVLDVVENVETTIDIINGNKNISDVAADSVTNFVIGKSIKKPFKNILMSASECSILNCGIPNFSWFKPEEENERKIEKMVLVYHNANRAGPHIDVHIGGISFVVRVPKDQESLAKVGRTGNLTQASKDALIAFVRNKIADGAMVPQNLDHSDADARTQWSNGGTYAEGYGAGPLRQIILDEPVEIITTHDDTSRVYAPSLNKHHNLFFHRLGKVVSVGLLSKDIPELKDKLHLKMTHDRKDFLKRVDPRTITLKEDSAAAYIVETPKGTTIWSPRISKETGRRIEYTGKLPEIARIKGDFVGIGELKFRKADGEYLSAAEAGGILNSDRVRPVELKPEIFLYRADKVGGKDVSDLSFFDNRAIQERQTNDFIKIVRFASPDHKMGEGLVGVPRGKSVNSAFKFPFAGDTDDWRVTGNRLGSGPTGRTAGVVEFESLGSGRRFLLGPGQIGPESRVREWMQSDIIGRVAKVRSKRGHEGRSAKFVEWHLDK